MHRMILTGSLLLALSTSAMAGQIYKWVDAQGNTHFGAQPPEGQQAAEVNPNVSQPKAPPADLNKPAEASKSAQQEAIDEKVKKDVAKREAERKKFCETVRTNLAQLNNNPRVRSEIDGEVRRLTEEERQTRISDSEKSIAEHCQ